MEIMLRCELEDRPGSLAALAGAVGRAGGDIQGVDILHTDDGRVLDDLVVVISEQNLGGMLDDVRAVSGVSLIHAGPSRGHPADAVTRVAIGLEALFVGSAEWDRGLATLIGGLLRADEADLVTDLPHARDGRVLALPVDGRFLLLRRPYRFTQTERERAEVLLRLCLLAMSDSAHASDQPVSSPAAGAG